MSLSSTNEGLFRYLKSRYRPEQVNLLNQSLKSRIKINNVSLSIEFYQQCVSKKLAPKFIRARIANAAVKDSPSIEKAFLTDEIHRSKELLRKVKLTYDQQIKAAKKFLTADEFAAVMKYISTIEERNEKSKKAKNESTISRLQRFRFGDNISPSAIHVNNLSSYSLSDQELFVLSHGMNFSLPPKSLNRLAVFAEFEVLMGQLKHHTPISIVKKQELQARLVDIAHSYCGTPINPSDRRMLRTCRDALRQLRAEESIVILKPDKGSGVVVLDKVDYIRKMTTILSDATKFRRIGPTEVHDNTSKIEDDVRKFLVELVKKKQLPKEVQEAIRPVGSQLPRLYGLPKTHKEGVPLRPILSMTNSVQHKLAKWLTRLLEPVLEFYSAHCIKDSFTFAEFMRGTVADTSSVMCSFDVSSLFTNVPLAETIRICADKLYEKWCELLVSVEKQFYKVDELGS